MAKFRLVLCPVALAVHCTGCPIVSFCPAKRILGDYEKDADNKKSAEEPDKTESGPPDSKESL